MGSSTPARDTGGPTRASRRPAACVTPQRPGWPRPQRSPRRARRDAAGPAHGLRRWQAAGNTLRPPSSNRNICESMIDDLRVLWDLHSMRREEYSLACWRMRCARDFSPSARSWSSLRWWPSWSGAEHPPRPQTARRVRRGASRTCRASGPTNSIPPCSAPAATVPGSSSPKKNGPSWTRQRLALLGRDRRVERGTELDVAGAYNSVFMSMKRTGRRTSLIVDPPDGRVPPTTPDAQKTAAADRDFRLALLQSTETCKSNSTACAGGKYDPRPSPAAPKRSRATTPRG